MGKQYKFLEKLYDQNDWLLKQEIKHLEKENNNLKNGVTYTRILQLEKENTDLRKRLDETYDFIHNTGNPDYFKKTGNAQTCRCKGGA